MPKPTNKEALLSLSNTKYKELILLVNSYSKKELSKDFPKGLLNRNCRDVLAHIHHWHTLFLDWYAVGMAGEKPQMPSIGYTWKTVPELNKEIQKTYLNTSFEEIIELLEVSFNEVQKIINAHTNEELFTKKKYRWTGTTSLGAYLISATSSHYHWGQILIKKSMKP